MALIDDILQELLKPGAGFKALLTQTLNELKARGNVSATNVTDLQTKSGADTNTVFVKDIGFFSYSASLPGGGIFYPASGGGYWLQTLNPGDGSSPTLSDPTGFIVGTATSSSLTISWNTVSNATHYILYRATQSDYSDAIPIAKITGLSYTDNGRTAATQYYYRVLASAAGYNNSGYATGSGTTSAASVWEPIVNAFDTATGAALDAAKKDALSAAVKSYRFLGTLTKLHIRLVTMGGTSAAHKINFVDPRDADNAFRLTYHGTITHSSNGMQGDGSTGWADTHFQMSELFVDDVYMAVYTRSSSSSSFEMGTFGTGGKRTDFSSNFSGPAARINAPNLFQAAGSFVAGYQDAQRDGNVHSVFRLGVSLGTQAVTEQDVSDQTLGLMAENSVVAVNSFSSNSICYFAIGRRLTTPQRKGEKIINQVLQSALSRAV